MKINYCKIESLIEYAFNNKKHDDIQIDLIANSIKEFGFNQPIVVDEDNIILCGHGRLLAAKKLNMTQVPVVQLLDLTDAQKKAYRIIDNKLGHDSEWNFEHLGLELPQLSDLGFDLEAWGLDDLQLESLEPATASSDDFGTNPDDDLGDIFISSGDVIELNGHRIICGDSADASVFVSLLADSRPCLVFTDPPYGVNIAAKNKLLNSLNGAKGVTKEIVSDDLNPEELKEKLLPAFINVREFTSDDCSIFLTAPQGGDLGMMMMMMMREAKLPCRHVLIWVKNQATFSMGRLDYDYQHEPILFTWKKNHKKIMAGQFKTSTWNIDKPRESKLHPTMKPVELYANAILNHTNPGDLCLDPFLGSGTMIIAAEQLGRKAFGVEIDPKYCQIIVNRFKQHCLDNNKEFSCRINGVDFVVP